MNHRLFFEFKNDSKEKKIMESTGLTFEKVWALVQETDKQMKANSLELKEMSRQTDKKLRQLENLFVGQWGKLIESLVEGDLVSVLNARGIPVNETTQRLTKIYQGKEIEIDIVAMNGDEVVFVEVKSNLKVEHVDYFLEKLENIKSIFPKFANNTVYGAVAYLRFESEAKLYAIRKGLFAIKATGKSAHIVNDIDFKPRSF